MLNSAIKRICIHVSVLITSFITLNVNAQNIKTVAGDGTFGYSGDGLPALFSENEGIAGIATDTHGNYYLADVSNHVIRKVDAATGIITRFAGDGTMSPGFGGDSGPATAAVLNYPNSIACDGAGNVYIADQENNRIRKVSATGIITTIAGDGFPGFFGEGVPATTASMASPYAICLDASGNIYFSDLGNCRIRKINTAGIISTIAGDGTVGMGADGVPATATQVRQVSGMCVDASGNIYLSEFYYHRIRMINTAGIITTIAGTGTPGFTGDGTPATGARLNNPTSVCLDASGNLYIADAHNHRVRMINPSGIISTVTGSATAGFSGDGGPATAATFSQPGALAFDGIGDLFIADDASSRVREIFVPPVASFSLTATSTCEDSCINIASTGTGSLDSIRWSVEGIPIPTSMPSIPLCFTSAGSYDISLAVYNISGASTATVTVTVYPVPHPTITYSGGAFAAPGGYVTYQWYKDGVLIPGATSDTYTSTGPGDYYVEVTDVGASGCPGRSPLYSTLGVNQVGNADVSVTLVPNPNNGIFSVKGSVYNQSGGNNVTLEITNVLGKIVYKTDASVFNGKLDTQIKLGENLPNGIYLLNTRYGSELKNVSRFVVDR